MCICNKSNKQSRLSFCKGITPVILTAWIDRFICSQSKEGIPDDYKNRIIALLPILIEWRDYKIANPEGCDYNENLREVQLLINYLIAKLIC